MQLITALFHPEKYPELAAKKWWKPVIYILFWTFFVTAVVNFINISVNRIEKEELKEKIPEFQIQDGVLQIEGGVYEFADEEYSLHIVANTDISEFAAEDIKGEGIQEVYITKDKMDVYLLGEKYSTFPISMFAAEGLTKEALVEFIYISAWIVSVLLIVFEGLAFFLQTLMYVLTTSFIADIVAKYMGKRIAFGKLFKSGIYASTFGVLCQLFQLWHILRGVEYEPTVFYYLSYFFTIIYMVRVVIKWKDEKTEI